jgi:hypothetical protein
MDKNPVAELIAVAIVGYGIAKVTEKIDLLNDNKMFTRTMLYTLGFVVAAHVRPAGGYKLLGDGK